jgi:hypothetical protein
VTVAHPCRKDNPLLSLCCERELICALHWPVRSGKGAFSPLICGEVRKPPAIMTMFLIDAGKIVVFPISWPMLGGVSRFFDFGNLHVIKFLGPIDDE